MSTLKDDLIAAKALIEKRPELGPGGALRLALHDSRREQEAAHALIVAKERVGTPVRQSEWLALFDRAIEDAALAPTVPDSGGAE